MILDSDDLQAIRGCCRDEAAFERLQTILVNLQSQVTQASARCNLRYEALLNVLPHRFFLVNRDGDNLDFKGTLEDATNGISAKTVIGTNLKQFVPPDVAQSCLQAIAQVLDSQTPQTLEYYRSDLFAADLFTADLFTANLDGRHYELHLVASSENEVLAIERDVTDRKRSAAEYKQIEARLLQAESQYRSIFDAMSDGLIINDPETGVVVEANPACCQMHGYTCSEFVGLPPTTFIHPDSHSLFEEYIASVNAGKPFRRRAIDLHKDGTPFNVEVIGTRFDYQGKPHLLAVLRDITEQIQAETALRESEARNRAFLNAVPDLMFRISRSGTYLDFKADKDADFAVPPDNMVGKTVDEVLPPAIAEQRLAYIQQTLETGEIQVYEYQLSRRGELRDYEARIVASGENEVLAIMRDITDRKRSEAQLRATADRDRLLGQIALRIRRSLNLDQILTTTVKEVKEFLNADRVFIGQIDAKWQGRIIAESASPEWGSILTWAVDDVYLREIRALFDQGQVRVINNTAEAELSPVLAEYYRRCHIQASLGVPIILGDEFFGVLVVNQCAQPRYWLPVEVELLTQLATQVAIAIQQAELYQQVQSSAASLEEQVQERTAQLQQNMQELQDLSQVKDDFLNAVSHDLRTPVMGMSMVLKNLQNKSGDTIAVPRSILDRMVESCDRQLSLINSLLEAHSSEVGGINVQSEQVNIGELARSIVVDLDLWISASQGTLTNLVPLNLPFAVADPELIRRVFENLLTNALKHNPPGLHLTVQAVVEDEMLRCTVQDNGVGITQSEFDSLFERYTRGTRARRSTGVGLGLYLCRQIITAHGGQIGVISSPNQGATFWFTLPLASE